MAVPCPAASEVQDRALSWGACGTPAHDFNNLALGSRIDQWSWDHKKFSLEYYNNWEDIRTSDLEDSVIFASITHSISDSSTLTTISIRTDLPFLPGMHRFPQDRTNPPNSHAKNVGYENLATSNFETYRHKRAWCIPKAQMGPLVLIGQCLVLEGWPSMAKVIYLDSGYRYQHS